MLKRFYDNMFSSVHPVSLGIFRIIVGLMLLIQFFRIEEYIVEVLPKSEFIISYDFFEWLPMLSQSQMGFLFFAMKMISILFMLGFLYRFVAVMLFIGWSYVFLIDAGHYNNHYYLYSIVLFLMIFVNADAWGSVKQLYSKDSFKQIPRWQIDLFKFQILVMYFYGGIAKINQDWLNGYPMRFWLREKNITPLLDSFLHSEFGIYMLSYGGLVFDLSIGFLLWNNKTRKWALIPLLVFHLMNHYLWTIGTFPFFSLAATLLFFPPDRIASVLRLSNSKLVSKTYKQNKWVSIFLSIFVCFQLLFPLRHHLYSGNAAWNGLGDSFAWRMMLNDGSYASRMKVVMPSEGVEGYVDFDKYVNGRQFSRFLNEPKFIWKFAHFLGDVMKTNGAPDDIEIYAYVYKSVNGRPYELLIDTTYNLLQSPYSSITAPDFIMPFKNTPIQSENLYTIDNKDFNEKFNSIENYNER